MNLRNFHIVSGQFLEVPYIKAAGDGDVDIAQYYNPGRQNDMPKGMKFSSSGSGHLKGTPAQEGTYTFWACAASEFGEDHREFTVTIKPAPPKPTATPAAEAASEATATPSPAPTAPVSAKHTPTFALQGSTNNASAASAFQNAAEPVPEPDTASASNNTLLIVLIVIGGLVLIAAVAIVVLLSKRGRHRM